MKKVEKIHSDIEARYNNTHKEFLELMYLRKEMQGTEPEQSSSMVAFELSLLSLHKTILHKFLSNNENGSFKKLLSMLDLMIRSILSNIDSSIYRINGNHPRAQETLDYLNGMISMVTELKIDIEEHVA